MGHGFTSMKECAGKPRIRGRLALHDRDDYLPEWEDDEDGHDDMESGMLHEYHAELRGNWNRRC